MRKSLSTLFVAALLLLSQMVNSQTYSQVWADEFNGSYSGDWVFETGGGGWGNNELQYYQQANATISNGNLVITAKRQSVGGYAYTSARMKTQGRKSWKFGKVEASIKVPSVQGLWPAFWMLGDNISSVGWPSCGEIDIMEQVNTSTTNYGTIHWNNGGHVSYGGNTWTSGGVYHNYSIVWTTSSIKWYVDGAQYVEANIANGINNTGCFQNNFFILLNMAVGGNWPGNTIGTLPASYYVDYVRVSQVSSGGFSQTIQAENYSAMSGVQTEATTDAGGGLNVGWIDANDWMAYTNNPVAIPATGTYTIQFRVASLSGGGRVQFEEAGGSPVYGSVAIPSTGGWQNWTTVNLTVNLNAGTHNFGLKALAGGWNLNYFKIVQGTVKSGMETSEIAESVSSDFSVYPTEVTDILRVKADGEVVAQIFDMQGKMVLNKNLGQNREINVGNLRNGMYIIKASVNGQVHTSKIFKR